MLDARWQQCANTIGKHDIAIIHVHTREKIKD